MKDNYSNYSDNYAKFRPTYPQTIFDFLYTLLNEKNKAWDCGTGSGQIAQELSKDFKTIEATDISAAQIENAYHANNIHYSIQPAEKTTFDANSFDLITVAQAAHLFDINTFNEEVKRVGKPNSIIALIGYEFTNITPEIDSIILRFHEELTKNITGLDRKNLTQKYQSIPFPFREFETPEITNIKLWKLEQLLGYLNTWSLVKNYSKINGTNPLDEISEDITKAWGNTEIRKVNFPLIFKVGRIT